MTTNEPLRIAIFGPGQMAQVLAPHWARARNVLTVSGRTADTAATPT